MQCSVVLFSAVQCSAVWCSVVPFSAVQCSVVWCSVVSFSAVQCSVVPFSAVQHITGQISAGQCCIRHRDQNICNSRDKSHFRTNLFREKFLIWLILN